MAFATSIPRSLRQPGIYRSVARTLPPGTTRVTLRPNSSWATGDIVLLGIEASRDGGVTWGHVISGLMYSGDVGPGNALPLVSLMSPDTSLQYRVLGVLTQAMDLGLDVEIV
jgi:hypothetical protein